MSQPAVSAAISSLETEYNVKLFHRVGRQVELAEAGQLLQVEAQNILDQVVMAERSLYQLNHFQRGELKLGASLTIGNYWLPAKIGRFKQEYPGISILSTLSNAEEIRAGVAKGQFDIGLMVGDIKPSQAGLMQEIIGKEHLQIVVGRSHAWFERDTVIRAELLETDWVMREAGSGVQQVFEQALKNWQINATALNRVLTLNSSEMVKAVVESGTGAAAIPELMIKNEIRLATLRVVQVIDDRNDLSSPLEIAQPILKLKHRQRYQSQLAVRFEQALAS